MEFYLVNIILVIDAVLLTVFILLIFTIFAYSIFNRTKRNPIELQDVKDEILKKRALGSLNKWKRIQSILLLSDVDPENSADILQKTLESSDEDVRYFSILALNRIRTSTAAKILLSTLKKRLISGYKIASILERFPEVEVSGPLGEGINNEDEYLKYWSLKILSKFNPYPYFETIEKLLTSHSKNIRAAACECLGNVQNEEAIRTVKNCLSDKDWVVRMYAIRALDKLVKEKSVPLIIHFLEERHWFLKEAVKQVLLKYREDSYPFVMDMLKKEDEKLRRDCLEILFEAGYLNDAIKGIISEDADRREESINFLRFVISKGEHYSLDGIIAGRPRSERNKILDTMEKIDKDIATHIRKKIQRKLEDI